MPSSDRKKKNPATVIVKKIREDEFEYWPDSSDSPNSAHWLFNDWAAAEFLNKISSTTPLSPTLYGGCRERGFIVLEDLGDGEAPTTPHALRGHDPELATNTLVEHVSLIGLLHAATIGRRQEYRDIRSRLGPSPEPGPLYQDPWSEARNCSIPSTEVDEAIRLYEGAYERLGIRPMAAVAEEIVHVTASVEAQPERFLAYCKGDQNMAGDYIRRHGTPRLFDFNAGGYRHAVIEGIPGRMTWGCMMRIPIAISRLMESSYYEQLVAMHPGISKQMFHQAMVETGARWHIFHVLHRLPDALMRDRQRGPTTLRQQMIAWLRSFIKLSEEFGGIPALRGSANTMLARLCNIWSAEASTLPYYPAFRMYDDK